MNFLYYYCAILLFQIVLGLPFVWLVSLAIAAFLVPTADRKRRALANSWLSAGLVCFLYGPLAVMVMIITGSYDPVRDDGFPEAAVPYNWARLITEVVASLPPTVLSWRYLRMLKKLR